MKDMNVEKVKQAVQLQKQINTDIDTFGCTSEYNCKSLDRLVDNMSDAEGDLFMELMSK